MCVCVALREDLYFDVGCLLALSLVQGGPPVGFFSPALYQCLFNYPPNRPLTSTHMTPDTHFTRQVSRVSTGQTHWENCALEVCCKQEGRMIDRVLSDCRGPVFRRTERNHDSVQRVPGARRLQPTNQQPGREGRSGGGSRQLHYDHQDAASSAEVERQKGRSIVLLML